MEYLMHPRNRWCHYSYYRN